VFAAPGPLWFNRAMTETAAPQLTADAMVLATYANGTVDYRLAEGVSIGVQADGRIYWATPGGWDWVLDNVTDVRGTRVLGDGTGWPTFHEDDYYIAHPAA
jgi:hypothetical protein